MPIAYTTSILRGGWKSANVNIAPRSISILREVDLWRATQTYQVVGPSLIKGGAVITVDPNIGTLPKADVLVRDGAIAEIGSDLNEKDIEIIDAADMIVMPGFVDSHYHMWSTLGRNFISDHGFEYFPAKWATSGLYEAADFYNSVLLGLAELANGGVTTVHNWSHNNRSPQHLDAELNAHRDSVAARSLRIWTRRSLAA